MWSWQHGEWQVNSKTGWLTDTQKNTLRRHFELLHFSITTPATLPQGGKKMTFTLKLQGYQFQQQRIRSCLLWHVHVKEISHLHQGALIFLTYGNPFMASTVTCENEKLLTASLCCQQYMLIMSADNVYLLCTAPWYKCSRTQLWRLNVAPQALCPSQGVDSADASVYKAANKSHQRPQIP